MASELPMQDVVKMVIDAEEESRRVIQEAQAEADHHVAAARQQAQELVSAVRRKTAEEVETLLRTAEQQSQREKEACLAEATQQIEDAVCLEESLLRSVTDAALRCVIGDR